MLARTHGNLKPFHELKKLELKMEVLINLVIALIGNLCLTISIVPIIALYDDSSELIGLHSLIIIFSAVHQIIGWTIFVLRKSPRQESPIPGMSIQVFYQIVLRTFIALTVSLTLMHISLVAVYQERPAERAIGISGILVNLIIAAASVYYCYMESITVKTTATESSLTLDTNQNTTI